VFVNSINGADGLLIEDDDTLFSALIGTTIGNMAAFGTDQDMVQRMLT
jgi:hypothetical protein